MERYQDESEAMLRARNLTAHGPAKLAPVYDAAWDREHGYWIPDVWRGPVHTFR